MSDTMIWTEVCQIKKVLESQLVVLNHIESLLNRINDNLIDTMNDTRDIRNYTLA